MFVILLLGVISVNAGELDDHDYQTYKLSMSIQESYSGHEGDDITYIPHSSTMHTLACNTCMILITDLQPHIMGTVKGASSSGHTLACNVCGYEKVSEHIASYSYNDSFHTKLCSVCNWIMSPSENHNIYLYASADAYNHVYKCSVCPNLKYEAHNWIPFGPWGIIMCGICAEQK